MAAGLLDRIVQAKRQRLRAGELRVITVSGQASDGEKFRRALLGEGPNIIAEIKHRSPSAGLLLPDPETSVFRVAKAYRRGGAAAISVVIEQDFFGGDPAWLPAAKEASGLPVLMKDFVIDEAQLDMALSLGADAVLLIVSALNDTDLVRLHSAARARGLQPLVEAHDEAEVRRALAVGADIIGVNSRDLTTFSVDLPAMGRLGRALPLPTGVIRVAESGIRTAADVASLSAEGYGAFLVGESLLTSGDEAAALRRLRGEGCTEVKICGLTSEEDLEICEAARVDFIGLNLSRSSPRWVSPESAQALARGARHVRGVVAVFAGNPEGEIRELAGTLGADVLQLTDPPVPGAHWPLPVWQTVRVGRDDLSEALGWPGEALLFDTAVTGVSGGTGRVFDWSLLDGVGVRLDRPFVLAGGLHAANVGEAIRRVKPRVVDVASGVEVSPGRKDPGKIARFVEEVRAVKSLEMRENKGREEPSA